MVETETMVVKTCQGCGCDFVADLAKQGKRQQYCTPKCRLVSLGKVKPRVTKNCEVCGNEFVTAQSDYNEKKICSTECHKKRQKIRNTSEETRKRTRENYHKKMGYAQPKEDELVFYNYKAPLTPLPPEKGFGYDGVVLYSKDAQKVQCHVCGMLFRNVATHANFAHGLTAVAYKKRFNLNQKTALVGEKTRDLLIKAHDGLEHGAFSHRGKTKAQVKAHMIKMSRKGKANSGRGGWTLEKRNQEGLCPAQLLEKIHKLGEKVGRRPTVKEYMQEYGSHMSIYTVFGSWNEAIRLSKYITVSEEAQEHKDPEYLLESMRVFYKMHKRTPQTSDARRGLIPPVQIYCEVFGTLNNARIKAGVPVLLRLSKYRYQEVKLPEKSRKMYIKKMDKMERKELVKFSANLK